MKIGWSCGVCGRNSKQRRKKMEEKIGWPSSVWVVECLCCWKEARKRNDGRKKNKKNEKKYNKVKKKKRQGYGRQVEERGERK